jgi:hypothetical protein
MLLGPDEICTTEKGKLMTGTSEKQAMFVAVRDEALRAMYVAVSDVAKAVSDFSDPKKAPSYAAAISSLSAFLEAAPEVIDALMKSPPYWSAEF